MSPNGRWICFNAVGNRTSRLGVVSRKGGKWTWLTDGSSWADKPRWSADGRLIYFVSQGGGLGAVWGIEFDPIAGEPVRQPFQLTHFTGPGVPNWEHRWFRNGYQPRPIGDPAHTSHRQHLDARELQTVRFRASSRVARNAAP